MKITILIKSGPHAAEANRALEMVSDLLAQDHSVNLYLMQDAVHFCRPDLKQTSSVDLGQLMDKKLEVNVLDQDAKLRGIDAGSVKPGISDGDYVSLVDLMASSDRVIGML